VTTHTGGDALAAVRNLAAKALRRASAVPKIGVRAARRARRLRDQAGRFQSEWRIERELAEVARGRRPVVVGPWLSEVGFEVLYWIPFLRWFEDRYRVDAERVIAVSRGGVADWYSDVATRYVEIFDHVDPATFGRRNAERRSAGEGGGQKQTSLSAFDEELIAAAKRQCGASDATVCHPSFMYRLFGQFWLGNRALDVVTSHTRHLRPAITARHFGLPARYVAAKFYTGAAIPDTPQHRRALRDLVARIAEHTPVVMLDTGMATDEHEDYLFRDVPNVITMRDQLTPSTNLGVQTAVIAGSQGFVGTCGSLAWLAPMLGVDTVAVYADDRLLVSHLFSATHVFRQMNAARFDTLDLGAALQFELASAPQVVSPGDRHA
jgi:hypothetical protein